MNYFKNKKVQTGLVLIVIAVVLFFVWRRYRTKSDYSTAEAASSTAALEVAYYSNLSACQNTFTTTGLGRLNIHTDITCSGTAVTASTLVPHGYTAGTAVYVAGVSSDGQSVPVKGYNSTVDSAGNITSITVTPDASNVYKYTYTSPVTCSGTPSTKGYSWLTSNTIPTNAFYARSNCFTSNVQMYMSSKCPWATPDSSGTIPVPTSGTELTAYNTYQSELQKIKDRYARLIQDSLAGIPGTPSQDIIQQARAADFTSPTRKYIQAVCPGFYKYSSTIDPGASRITKNAATNNPPFTVAQSPYNTYTATLSGTGTVTSGSGFNPDLVTGSRISEWYNQMSAASAPTTALTTYYAGGGDQFVQNLLKDIGPGTVTPNGIIGTTAVTGYTLLSSM